MTTKPANSCFNAVRLPLAAAGALIAAVAADASPRDGELDPSFGEGGLAIVEVGHANTARGIGATADGRIVIAGQLHEPDAPTGPDIALVQLTREGQPDAGFGNDGRVVLRFGQDFGSETPNNLIVQRDGRIVVAADGAPHATEDQDFMLARFNSDGTPDTSFSGDGIAFVPFDLGGTDSESTQDLVQDAQGRLVVVGGTDSADGTFDFAIVRLNGNGTRDFSFSGDGLATVKFPLSPIPNREIASSVAIDAQGRIVVAGIAEKANDAGDFAVARLLPNGALDASFGGDGRVAVPFDLAAPNTDFALEMVLAPDGSIFVTGVASAPTFDLAAVKLRADGSLDPAFGGDGKVSLPFNLGGENSEIFFGAALQDDGRLLLAGTITTSSNDNRDVALLRLLANGSPDPSFGFGGLSVIPLDLDGESADEAFRAILDRSRLLFVGTTQAPDRRFHFLAGRVLTDVLFASDFEAPR